MFVDTAATTLNMDQMKQRRELSQEIRKTELVKRVKSKKKTISAAAWCFCNLSEI